METPPGGGSRAQRHAGGAHPDKRKVAPKGKVAPQVPADPRASAPWDTMPGATGAGGSHVGHNLVGAVPEGGELQQAGLPALENRGWIPADLDGGAGGPRAAAVEGPRGAGSGTRRPRGADVGERPALADGGLRHP